MLDRERVVALQSHEHAEHPADRAHLAEAQADHADAVAVGREPFVEARRGGGFVDESRDLRQPDQRGRPGGAEREVVESLRDSQQLRASVLGTSAQREDERERGAPRGKIGNTREDVERRLDELRRVPALPAENHQLRAVYDGGVRMLCRDSELERLVCELLGVVEMPSEERERRLEPQYEVPQRRLAELLHQGGGHLRFLVGVVDLAPARASRTRDARDR